MDIRASRVDNLTCCKFLSLVNNVVPFLGAVGAQTLRLSLAAAMQCFEWLILHMAYLDKGCEWNSFAQHTHIYLYLMICCSIFRAESFLVSFISPKLAMISVSLHHPWHLNVAMRLKAGFQILSRGTYKVNAGLLRN